MKKVSLFVVGLLMIGQLSYAQKYFTQKGVITFFSSTPMENISAKNNFVNSLIDIKSGDIAFTLLQKSFEFPDKLMQEHFNDKYMESDKYPKSTFEGKINNIADINLSKDGAYKVTVEGKLTMHGVTNDVKAEGTLTVKGAKITADSKFSVKLVDYKIEVPKLVTQKIAETIDITVSMAYEPFKK